MAIVIIGSGFAGASCAWWLAGKGVKDITVLEQEEMPGIHSSGLNAGFARQFEEDKEIAPLALEGVEFIKRPPKGFIDRPIIELCGSLFLMDKAREKETAKGLVPPTSKIISKREAVKMVPPLSTAKFDSVFWTPDDGIIDIHSYLWAFVNGAKARGVKFIMNAKIAELRPPAKNSRWTVNSLQGSITADIVVNATGAWAQAIGNMAGAEDLRIKPYRRHLYCTPAMQDVDPKWPFVWDMVHEYYFRPESGGLLLGACDEEEVAPGVPKMNPKIKEVLAEKLLKYCPSLASASIAREWCGTRTFAPNRRPVIRFDKKVKSFFWLAALGGRGVTCAASAGRVAAEMILQSIR